MERDVLPAGQINHGRGGVRGTAVGSDGPTGGTVEATGRCGDASAERVGKSPALRTVVEIPELTFRCTGQHAPGGQGSVSHGVGVLPVAGLVPHKTGVGRQDARRQRQLGPIDRLVGGQVKRELTVGHRGEGEVDLVACTDQHRPALLQLGLG